MIAILYAAKRKLTWAHYRAAVPRRRANGGQAVTFEVSVMQHPKGALMRIERADRTVMILDREEAWELHEQIAAKLGEMPVNIEPSKNTQPK